MPIRLHLRYASIALAVVCTACGGGSSTKPSAPSGGGSEAATGGAHATGGGGQGGQCAALEACCATLGAKQAGCEDFAKSDQGVEANCRTTRDLLCPTHTCADLL